MKKKVITVLVSILVLFFSTQLSAHAQESTLKNGSVQGAIVSEEVDRASGGDNNLGTQYFMYIPPKLHAEDFPKTGDTGTDINIILFITIGVGVTYLGCHYYAYRDS